MTKLYEVTVKNKDGSQYTARMSHVNFDGTEEEAKALWNKQHIHTGATLVSLKEVRNLDQSEVNEMATAIETGRLVPPPTE